MTFAVLSDAGLLQESQRFGIIARLGRRCGLAQQLGRALGQPLTDGLGLGGAERLGDFLGVPFARLLQLSRLLPIDAFLIFYALRAKKVTV